VRFKVVVYETEDPDFADSAIEAQTQYRLSANVSSI